MVGKGVLTSTHSNENVTNTKIKKQYILIIKLRAGTCSG